MLAERAYQPPLPFLAAPKLWQKSAARGSILLGAK